jgi:hypothetical protein
LITTIFTLFGDPAQIAAEHTHTKPQRGVLLTWLRAGEAMLRHLLLIEAAAHARPNTRPLLRVRRKRVRRRMGFDADKPEAWRVSFRCLADPPRSGARAPRQRVRVQTEEQRLNLEHRDRWHQARWPRPQFYSAWPLAERAEAMLRVFNTPEPYARRLARRLYATPHRAADLTRIPENLPTLVDDFRLLRRETETARRRFDSG